jgi:YVTN family beta-propeller protein
LRFAESDGGDPLAFYARAVRFLAVVLSAAVLLAACAWGRNSGVDTETAPATSSSPATPASTSVSRPSVAASTVSIPGGASRLALDATRGRLYAAGANTLSAIDTATRAVLGTFALPQRTAGTGPAGAVVVDEKSGYVYVTDFVDDDVFVVDGPTLALVATVPVGRGPVALALDTAAHWIYIANLGQQSSRAVDDRPGSVSVLDTNTRRTVSTLALAGHPVALALDARRGLLYVPELRAAGVAGAPFTAVIDARSQREMSTLALGGATSIPTNEEIAMDEALDAVYAIQAAPSPSPAGANVVMHLDPATNQVRLLVNPQGWTAVAVRSSGPGAPRFYLFERYGDGTGRLWILQHLGGSVEQFVRVSVMLLDEEPSEIVPNPRANEVYLGSRMAALLRVVVEPAYP